MGRAKEWMMEQEALEPMYEWIEENYAGEEGSEEWEEAVQAYEEYCEHEEEWYQPEELEWYIYTQSQVGKFETQIQSVREAF
ncbi:hypothetical protein [Pseudidiomarina salinarum]|uniref:hypothetical protein n=1 Tax=Pseudidiomarina salinarum TaxID=435908 RepID=UPI00068C7B3C|nr:hypothetical protein [Pseudidiomarina salinarum]RUO70083.1 hypothetical protein CWI79_01040 [Pseudidiomarina salinarum]